MSVTLNETEIGGGEVLHYYILGKNSYHNSLSLNPLTHKILPKNLDPPNSLSPSQQKIRPGTAPGSSISCTGSVFCSHFLHCQLALRRC